MFVRSTRRCLVGAIAVLAILLTLPTTTAGAAPTVHFDGSPGTAAPPSALGPYSMTPFDADDRPLLSSVTSVPSPLGGEVTFDHTVGKGRVGQSWSTWGHGYSGDMYHNTPLGRSPDPSSVTLTLPPDTVAFYFYVSSNLFGTFQTTATAQDGTTSGPVAVTAPEGATYFGFWGSDGARIESITVTHSEATYGFGIGEFAIAMAPPPPPPVDDVGVRINDDAVVERDSGKLPAQLWVTLTAPSDTAITVAYKTTNQTAVAPGDYRVTSGVLTFAPGETKKPVKVPVQGDSAVEMDETFLVTLSGLTGPAVFIDNVGVGTIVNDD